MPTTMPLVPITRALSKRVDALSFAEPVACVYNPLAYARAPHELYLERYGVGPKEAVFVGMNPGPFGMAQTGVPFGDVTIVRDFLGIEASVKRPASEHEKRRIEGFACARSEVSGTRFWGFARERFGTADAFFARFFVWNYCPLVFMSESGANVTPDKLPVGERAPLFEACDAALVEMVRVLRPKLIIGVGAWATERAKLALGAASDTRDIRVGAVLHPSPASPRANRGWAEQASADLVKLGVALP